MSLDRWWGAYQEFSGLASSVSRQTAFAGIAVVWVLSNNEPGNVALPADLLWPSLFLVGALVCDFLQYFVSSVVWHFYAKYKERELGVDYDGDDPHPSQLNLPGVVFYYGKCLAVMAGYFFLAKYIFEAISVT